MNSIEMGITDLQKLSHLRDKIWRDIKALENKVAGLDMAITLLKETEQSSNI